MKVLLDTNAVIAFIARNETVRGRIRDAGVLNVHLSAIVMHELYYGAYKSARAERSLAQVEALGFAVLDFDRADAREAGMIRAALAARGTPIGPFDVLIAGQARARGLTLVTRNLREFERVEGLSVENWEG